MNLKAVEPLIGERSNGSKEAVDGAGAAAVESTLHEGSYRQAELEETIGTSLSHLFEGNESQLKSVAFANKHGEPATSASCSWMTPGSGLISIYRP